MKPDLVSPDFLFTFGFTFGKHAGNISISEIAISNLLRKSNVSIMSSLILRTTNAVKELVTICYHSISLGLFSFSRDLTIPHLDTSGLPVRQWGFFRPRSAIVKRDKCRNRVNIWYS